MDELFESVARTVPSSLGKHSWYIIATSALTASGKPEALSQLYLYLQGPKSPLTNTEKAEVSTRLQDVLGKAWTLVGVPLVVLAFVALAKAEAEAEGEGEGGEEGGKWEEGREEWHPPTLDPTTTTARGTAFLQTLYQQNLAPTFALMGRRHAPYMEWLERTIIYGLFLSDHTVLTPVESSITILTSIMCQGLRAPTMWHLRGLRRLGVSEEDVKKVGEGVRIVARWAGKNEEEVTKWVGVEENVDYFGEGVRTVERWAGKSPGEVIEWVGMEDEEVRGKVVEGGKGEGFKVLEMK